MSRENRRIRHELMCAAIIDQERARAMIESDPEILKIRDCVGETALHYLAIENYVDAVGFLLQHGAEVNTCSDFLDTPLMSAASLGYVEMCELLLKSGADPNRKNSVDETALHNAAAHSGDQYVQIVRMLIDAGAEPRVSDGFETPLQTAASSGSRDVALVLIEKGVDPDFPNEYGKTALHSAAYKGDVGFIRLLLNHGADPNARAEGGNTPLHEAAQFGHPEVVEELLKHGADAGIRDNDGETPLDLAAKPRGILGLLKRKRLAATIDVLKRHADSTRG